MGFVPGLNVVASGLGALSAGVDAAQGQYGDAAFRGGMAALGLVPGLGSAGTFAGKGLAGAGKFALKGVGAGLLKTGKAQRLGSSLMGYGTKLGKYKTSLAANQMRTIGAQSMLKGTAARNVAKNQFGTRALRSANVGGLVGAANVLYLANDVAGNPIGQAYDYLTRKSSKPPQSGDPNVHWSAQEILDRARDRQASSTMGPANVSSAINQSDTSGSSEKFRNRF